MSQSRAILQIVNFALQSALRCTRWISIGVCGRFCCVFCCVFQSNPVLILEDVLVSLHVLLLYLVQLFQSFLPRCNFPSLVAAFSFCFLSWCQIPLAGWRGFCQAPRHSQCRLCSRIDGCPRFEQPQPYRRVRLTMWWYSKFYLLEHIRIRFCLLPRFLRASLAFQHHQHLRCTVYKLSRFWRMFHDGYVQIGNSHAFAFVLTPFLSPLQVVHLRC